MRAVCTSVTISVMAPKHCVTRAFSNTRKNILTNMTSTDSL